MKIHLKRTYFTLHIFKSLAIENFIISETKPFAKKSSRKEEIPVFYPKFLLNFHKRKLKQ